jgi:hypothetical protein
MGFGNGQIPGLKHEGFGGHVIDIEGGEDVGTGFELTQFR